MRRIVLLQNALCVALAIGSTVGIALHAADVISIASVLSSPTSFHRRAVMLQGVVRRIIPYESRNLSNNQPMCSQDFILEDDTGEIEVVYMARCQVGEEKAIPVTQGESLTVYATIDAPPDNMTNTDGSEFGFRAMATKIMHARK